MSVIGRVSAADIAELVCLLLLSNLDFSIVLGDQGMIVTMVMLLSRILYFQAMQIVDSHQSAEGTSVLDPSVVVVVVVTSCRPRSFYRAVVFARRRSTILTDV